MNEKLENLDEPINLQFWEGEWNNNKYVDEILPTNLNCNKNGRNIYKD